MTTSHHCARGFTLIEALVALVVLSIGLLGIASLQLTSLRFNQGASMRTQATLLSYDIIDRMRANSQAAAKSAYNIALGTVPTATGTVAQNDLKQWKEALAMALPAGDGQIKTKTANGNTSYEISIKWDDSRGAKQFTTFTMETQL